MKIFGYFSGTFFLVFSTSCFAQATANFTASVTIIQPVGITTTSNMHFANLDAKSGGAIILSPDNSRTTVGGVEIAEGGQVSAATFEVTGESGFTYSITLPQDQYKLTNGSDNITIKNFTSNFEGIGLLVDGTQKVSVGATLDIEAKQTPGNYISTSPLSITVNYN